jgi:hypothetical protein
MLRKVNDDDLIAVKRIIEKQGYPVFFENKFGKFALVLTDSGKKRFLNEGYIAITLNELRNWIKDCKSFKQQQKVVLGRCKNLAEGFKTANRVKEMFQGKITNFT